MSCAIRRCRVEVASVEAVAHIAANLRQADRDECAAYYASDPYAMTMYSFNASRFAWVGYVGDEPATVFGCVDSGGGNGIPWLVGTDALTRIPLTFVRLSKPFLEVMRGTHSYLTNYVDSRNKLSIRWLRWLGFTIEPALPAGPHGVPFHRFWMAT